MGGRGGQQGGRRTNKKKRSRYLGEMLPFGNPKSLYQLFSPGPTYQVASIHEPGGSRGSAGWKKDQKKKLIDTTAKCYHLAIQNLCTSSSLTWAYIPGSQHP